MCHRLHTVTVCMVNGYHMEKASLCLKNCGHIFRGFVRVAQKMVY